MGTVAEALDSVSHCVSDDRSAGGTLDTLDPKKQPKITDILNWNQVEGISDIIYHETLILHDMNQVLCGADQQLFYYGRK